MPFEPGRAEEMVSARTIWKWWDEKVGQRIVSALSEGTLHELVGMTFPPGHRDASNALWTLTVEYVLARGLLGQELSRLIAGRGTSETTADLWSLLIDYGCAFVASEHVKLKTVLGHMHFELKPDERTIRSKRDRETSEGGGKE
jgi:hypothetical protein